MEHCGVQKQDGIERLILRRRAYSASRQTGDKCRDFRLAELARMALAMKDNEPPNPCHVRGLSPPAVMPQANCLTHLIEELRGRSARGRVGRSIGVVHGWPCGSETHATSRPAVHRCQM